jgi:hypothetical protein
MKPLVFVSAIFLFLGLANAIPGSSDLSGIKSFTPVVKEAETVTKDDLCSAVNSPAKKSTQEAMEAFKTALLYMFGALINEKETNKELSEAASWQLDQTEQIRQQALQFNAADKSPFRRDWYSIRLKWLRFKIKVAKGVIGFGIPSWPWAGDMVNWFKGLKEKIQERWAAIKTWFKSFFSSGDSTPTSPTTPATPNGTPASPFAAGVPATTAPALEIPAPEVKATPAELIQAVKAETPKAAESASIDAQVQKAVETSAMVVDQKRLQAKGKTQDLTQIIESRVLIQANRQPIHDELLKKLGIDLEKIVLDGKTEIAKVDALLAELETANVCKDQQPAQK